MPSKIKSGFENATLASAKVLAQMQTGVDKVLWGKKANVYSSQVQNGTVSVSGRVPTTPQAAGTTQFDKAQVAGAANTEEAKKEKKVPSNPLDLGVFPILDLLVSVDLCNILQSILSLSGGLVPKPRKEEPTATESALYNIQDVAADIQKAIDSFTSYPDRLIGRFTGTGIEGTTQDVINSQTNPQNTTTAQQQQNYQSGQVPGSTTSGTNTQKFNVVNLIGYVRQSLLTILQTKDIDGKQILEPQDLELLQEVPGLQNNLNVINDYLATLDRYSDYRNIDDQTLQTILKKVNQLRIICVAVQGLDFRNPQSVVAFLPPGYIQDQANKIQEFFPIEKVTTVLKQIDQALKAFMRTVQKVQGIVSQGQTFIRIGILLLKVFKVVVTLLKKLPIPNLYTVVGQTNTFTDIVNRTTTIIDDLVDILKQINQLLALVVSFIRYVQANLQQILQRLRILLTNLEGCNTLKNNPILTQLQQTEGELLNMQNEVQAFLNKYDTNTSPTSTTFGKYKIQIVDEEVVDPSIVNRRRRGIALDQNGVFVLQSDLTFATDLQIIIQEVKIKLVQAGLVQPGLGQIAGDVAVITDSLSFLEENELSGDDVELEDGELENPDSEDENEGLGLQAFINKLKGGKRLRKRVRQRLVESKRKLASSLAASDPSGRYTGNVVQRQLSEANKLEIKNLQEQIAEWKKEIAAATILPPGPTNIAIIRDRTNKIKKANIRIKQLGG